MADTSYPLPDYLRSAKPNPAGNRAAWFKNTAPSYAGIFLWIAFYDQMAGSTLGVGGIGAALIGLVVAGLISFVFYLAFGMWGMKTGQPLYIVGTSTFGEKGGYLAPGLLMGALQVGWYSVGTFFATQYILNTVYGVGAAPVPGDVVFIITGVVWGYVFALLGVLGIQYVAKVSQFFPAIPLLMLIYAAIVGLGGLGDFNYAELGQKTAEMNGVEYVSGMGVGIIAMISVVIGFFATAAAAGADFGMNARDKNDVVMGGLVGITLFIFISGALPMIAIAGIMGSHPELAGQDGAWTFTQAIGTLAGGRFIYLIFAIASMAPACFCSFIIANSFSTMIPSISRMAWTMGGATIGIILAVTGKAGNLIPFFAAVGALFGPICGAVAADYLISGGVWPGPRKGINLAGYIAIIPGFIVAIDGFAGAIAGSGFLPALPQPTAVYLFVLAFVLYFVLAKIGLQPQAVAMPSED